MKWQILFQLQTQPLYDLFSQIWLFSQIDTYSLVSSSFIHVAPRILVSIDHDPLGLRSRPNGVCYVSTHHRVACNTAFCIGLFAIPVPCSCLLLFAVFPPYTRIVDGGQTNWITFPPHIKTDALVSDLIKKVSWAIDWVTPTIRKRINKKMVPMIFFISIK